jgi:very-short-patch-repair endonuclease
LEELRLLRELTLVLMESPAPPIEIVVRSGWEEIDSGIGAWIEHGRARDRLRNDVGEEGFRVEIIALDLDSLRTGLERASASRWPLSWWRMWPVQRSLRSVALDGRAPRRERLRDVLDLAYGLREDQRKLDAASEAARVLLGRFWNDGEAEWDVVSRVREWARRLRELALRAARSDFELAASLRDRWARLASDLRELLGREGRAGREFISFGDALESFTQSRDRVAERLDLEAPLAWGSDSAPDALGRTRSRTAAWQESLHRLRYWCAWRRARAEAARRDVSSLVEAYEQGEITCDQMGPVFERSYAQWWLDAMVDREPVLNQFFSPEHERKIERFRSVDDRYMELTRGLIQARLAQQVPAMAANVTPNSEVGILKRQIGLKRRQLSIRQLLERIPNLLPRLKPCLLMSPMSVAQYLDAGYPPFDVVVFDEASQIPVWDAVGAIARGHQAVVVGDPKQLPPTNFFQRVDDDDDVVEEDVVEDLESILEECITARLPSLSLEWHYRSRHESLITFSNYHYYRNRLLTFPSPMLSGLGVSWQHVPQGVYDKGKSRTNRAEADAVVADILSRLRHPEQAQQSIGVVTFSQAQQTLIEDLLDAARAEDPQLDPYFAEDNDEPVFVKNLENVQGDERDVILFSICYGPDALGRVSMNFGPMNRDGGERRLNVAVTRARLAVKVFSTLRADQVDLNRTRARGVRDLKGFLEYAERGPSALAEATQPDPDADFDSPFEEAVWDALVQRGWQVHMQVGCARYRIDLAVLDPEAAGRYLLGVECDGANYHRARTARDRDKLREGVLRDLGWKLHRIWSTDWWTDPQRELDKLEAALERARTEGAGPSIVAARGDGRRTLPPPSLAPAENAVRSGISSETPALPLVSDLRAAPAVEPPDAGLARYQPIDTLGTAGSQADFYDSSAVPRIRSVLSEVVRHEGPISLRLAARRVAACWGFERVRAPALDRIRRLIPRDQVVLRRSAAGEFLWPGDVDPETFATFRVPGAEGDGERDATDLPLEEVCAGVRYVLDLNLSTPREELVRQTARLFGFGRVGSVVAKRIDSAVDALIEKGVAREDDGLVSLSHEEGF